MPTPRLCATVATAELEDLRRARDAAAGLAELVELRLDRLDRPDVAGALAGRRGPVVVTCRPVWDGGGFEGAEEDRLALLEEALRLGAEYVDVEWRAGERARALVQRLAGRRIVLSLHDFEGVPRDLGEQCQLMLASGAEVVKLAVTATRLRDNLALLALGRRFSETRRLVLIAMGAPGIPSRVLAARFGSCWSYAGDAAPGQIPLHRLIHEFRFRAVSAATAVYGILGRPLGHSLSPAMHNAAFTASGIDAVYVPFEAESVEDFRQLALALDLRGASVTAPFKVDVWPYLTRADDRARQAGAVNTIKVRGDHWDGVNTDADSFLAPLQRRVALDGVRVAVVGAGGAARAVAAALAGTGARVTVHARRLEAAMAVAAIAGGRAAVDGPRPANWDVLVNATPVGTAPRTDCLPVDPRCLDGRLVYDLVYRPRMTALRRAAEAAGCATIGGLEMLLAQGAAQFEWWTGVPAPADAMREAAEAALQRDGE